MTKISVSKKEDLYSSVIFEVEVGDGVSKTNHVVSLDDSYYMDLTGGKVGKEELIKESFEFLLEREPKETILSKFDLSVIQQYFPEYEKTIRIT